MTAEETYRGGWLYKVCCRLLGGGYFRSLRTRRRRRLLSAAYVAVAVAFPVVGYAVGEMWAVMAVFLAFGAVAVLMTGATGGMFEKPMRRLDEGQRYMRQAVLSGTPYHIGAVMGLAGGLIVAFALDQPEEIAMGWLLGVNSIVMGLPAVVGAWRLPDEVEDDD